MHLAYKNKLSKIKKRKGRKHFQGERNKANAFNIACAVMQRKK